jgi:hypothetical protein
MGSFGVKDYGNTCLTEIEEENVKGFKWHFMWPNRDLFQRSA